MMPASRRSRGGIGRGPIGGGRGASGPGTRSRNQFLIQASSCPSLVQWVNSSAEAPPSAGLQPQASESLRAQSLSATNVRGDLYYPVYAAGHEAPTVIWLHGYSYPLGYMWVYRRTCIRSLRS